MRRTVLSLVFLLVILSVGIASAYADERVAAAIDVGQNALPLELTVERTVTRSRISLGTELNQLTSGTGTALGVGPRAAFSYGLSDKWSLAAAIDCLVDTTDSPGAFIYSGLNGTIHYTILGSSLRTSTRVIDKGVNIISEAPGAKRSLSAVVGAEQLFLNGTANIYPAVGFLIGAAYTFGYWGQEFQVDTRYTTLQANNNPLSMISIGFGINLTL